MKIVFAEPITIDKSQADQLQKTWLKKGHELVIYPDRDEREDALIRRLSDADIGLVSNIPLNREIIQHFDKMKYLVVAFSGTDHIDLEACKEKGIQVSNAAGYSNESVAELSIGLTISLYRDIITADKQTRKPAGREGMIGKEIHGKTVGIIGTGLIGSKTAQLFTSLGAHVLGVNRSGKKSRFYHNVSMKACLQKSDIISLHVPLTEDTKHMIGEQELSYLKPGAVLINASRGPVVDYHALADALKSKNIAGAALDVYETEPPLPEDHPLFSVPNCLLMPHIGYATEEAMKKRIEIVFENIQAWLEGKLIRTAW